VHWCYYCYGLSPRGTGRCVHCGGSVEGPAGLSYDDRLIWALGHRDGDRAMVAARVLGDRRVRAALPALRHAVDDGQDPFLARQALRSASAIGGVEDLRHWLEGLARSDSFMIRAVACQALAGDV
jgi:HEAT repeat protein